LKHAARDDENKSHDEVRFFINHGIGNHKNKRFAINKKQRTSKWYRCIPARQPVDSDIDATENYRESTKDKDSKDNNLIRRY
jgi:hypothetical protein